MNDLHAWLRVLDLEPGVSFEDVRRAHRDMAKVWHPDRFPNDQRLREKAERHQKAINEAFGNLEKWVRAGNSLPALPAASPQLVAAEAPYIPQGNPPLHKRHPLRDTWTMRSPLGVHAGYKRGRSKKKTRIRTREWRWVALAAIVLAVIAVFVIAFG